MDHRRKHPGYKSIGGDYESGDSRHGHAPGVRRSRLSAVALLSFGLVVVFVGIMTLYHFSHVNTLHDKSGKGKDKPIVLRREVVEGRASSGAGGDSGGGVGSWLAAWWPAHFGEPDVGDDDDYGSDDDVHPGAVGEADDDGSTHDDPIDKGEKDDDGAANDQPFDKGALDDDGAANDDPIDKGETDDDGAGNDDPIDKGWKDDDGAENDQPVDKGEKDDDGAENDDPIDKGEKDDDGAANDDPIDKGEKDDDGAANDDPIDKGEKDDDGAENDDPIDKGEKDDDGAANDDPIDKGEKDDDGAANDDPIDKGWKDDDGAQHDHPVNLAEDDDTGDAAGGGGGDTAAAATGAAAGGKAAGGTSNQAAAVAAGDTRQSAREDDTNPEQVDDVTDYDDDGSSDLYMDANPDVHAGDYLSSQDVSLELQDREQRQRHQAARERRKRAAAGKKGAMAAAAAAAAEAAAGAAATDSAAEAAVVVAQPPNGCGPLSRELLAQWAVNNTVLLTFTNAVMFNNFGATWLYWVQKSGIKYWVLAVADEETAQLVRSRGVDHCFLVHENEIDNTAADFKWGSKSWQLHTWQKVLVVRHVHQLGFHVINSDMDVVWLRNPLEHFLVKYPAADYWVSMDPITTQNPLGDDGPEVGVSTHHYMNTGVYFLRQTSGGKALIDKWYDIRLDMQRQGYHDQDGLYNYFKDSGQSVQPQKRVSMVVDGKTALAQLPATLFQNGYSHCINQIHKIHGLQPFEVHFVWVWGGNAGKINRMREQQYFIDPPAYYSDGYFLSYDVQPIKDPEGFNEWSDTEAMVQTHLKALDNQLTDTWHGLALAVLLDRIVILPKMKCYCIQNWFENPQCRLPGEPHTRFPLAPACPADYVFNMDALAALNVSGRAVPFREFSFLDNERTPREVKDDPLVVVASNGVTDPAFDPKTHTLIIPAGLKSALLLHALEPHLHPTAGAGAKDKAGSGRQQPKRVHFQNPREAFGGWSDPGTAAAFDLAVQGLAVRWCCRPDRVAKEHNVEVHQQLSVHSANVGPFGSSRRLQMLQVQGPRW